MKYVSVAVVFSVCVAANVARATPVTVPEGVADPLPGQGTGLCAASAISSNPQADFSLLAPANFVGAVNSFIDAHAAGRVEQVIRTPFDLSNNNSAGVKSSYGDFIDAVLPTCKTGGCDFFNNDPTVAFGSRMRGYFNVTADLANKPIHFGFYGDDAFSFTVFGTNNQAHPVVVRPAEIGKQMFRLTNQVTFLKPGLYPVEVLYIQITEHAALEMSTFVGDFQDFERPANEPPIVKLNNAGFTLLPPTSFFQTLSGNPSFPDLDKCAQCDRQFVNQAGVNGCLPGAYCNDAALCAPCDSNMLCGPSCSPCGGATPFCVTLDGNVQCANCRTDADCDSSFTCEPTTKTCKVSEGGVGGGGGSAGGGGSGGSGGSGADGSCACRLDASASSTGSSAIWSIAFAAAAWARSRRRSVKNTH